MALSILNNNIWPLPHLNLSRKAVSLEAIPLSDIYQRNACLVSDRFTYWFTLKLNQVILPKAHRSLNKVIGIFVKEHINICQAQATVQTESATETIPPKAQVFLQATLVNFPMPSIFQPFITQMRMAVNLLITATAFIVSSNLGHRC